MGGDRLKRAGIALKPAGIGSNWAGIVLKPTGIASNRVK
jgi:hypothetical protein